MLVEEDTRTQALDKAEPTRVDVHVDAVVVVVLVCVIVGVGSGRPPTGDARTQNLK